MTKQELEIKVKDLELSLENALVKLKKANEQVETHKKSSFDQQKIIREKDIDIGKKEELELSLKIATEEVDTHKRAAYEQTKKLNEVQLERDTIKKQYESVTIAYNEMAEIFEDYVKMSRNSLKQLEGLAQASVMLENNITEKIKNFNKGDKKWLSKDGMVLLL